MDEKQQIIIRCEGHSCLELDELEIFQGNLKDLAVENYDKLKRSILKLGFSFPISIWQNKKHNYILDGTQRTRTLQKMRDEGYKIPSLPIVRVAAKSFNEAREKVLAGTSQFGEITNEGLYEFISESDLNYKDVILNTRFSEIDFDRFEKTFYVEPVTREVTFTARDNPAAELEAMKKENCCPRCGYSLIGE